MRKTKTLILGVLFRDYVEGGERICAGVLWDWHLFYALSRIEWMAAIRTES